jgi:predicted GNAT superfamily acetyltransferase
MSAPATHPAVTIRPVQTVAEYRACQEIQRRAWGITEDGYVVPVATMISVQHAGGLVLGAFEGERLIGFAFAYLGRVRGKWALYSQLAAVDPSVQSHGVGGALKLAQRAWAREQGLALVAWSYDPLQAGNANFNLHRLGAFSRTYHVNYFGERTDALNVGLDTDRLLVEWPAEDRPRPWLGEDLEPVEVIESSTSAEGMRVPLGLADAFRRLCVGHGVPGNEQDAVNHPLYLEIPADIAALKARDLALARRWQQVVREAFLQAFAAGYIAMDFHRHAGPDGIRAWYVLRRPAWVEDDEPAAHG